MCLRAVSAIKNLISLLGDNSEEAGMHSCVLLESIVSVLGSVLAHTNKEKGMERYKKQQRIIWQHQCHQDLIPVVQYNHRERRKSRRFHWN